jgi:glycosyltransferase involved in cell wall biosynthesis
MRSNEILYVVGSLEIGGSERHLALVTPGLKSRGWRPVIFCLTHRGILADDLQKDGVEIVDPPLKWDGAPKIVRLAALLASAIKLFAVLLRRRPAAAHFFLPMAYLIGAPLAILARVRVRILSRRSLNHYQDSHPLLRRIELALHPHMHALLGNSRAVVAQLEAECGRGPAIELIYNGIPIAPLSSAGVRRGHINGDALTLVIVANLIAYKGHADLFQALAKVAGRLPHDWRLLCVGRDDGIGGELVALAAHLGIQDHIHLLGSRQDVADLLAQADIGLLCSHEEGFSNAILEGMAAGLPMIVTDVGGNAEAVVDRTTGLVVPAKDPAALGAAILTLAQDPSARDRMGRAGRERVAAQFSLVECVRRYDELYRKFVER